MSRATLDARGRDLRESVRESERRLEESVARLGRVSTEVFSVGGSLASDPIGWVGGALLVGLAIGLISDS